MNNFEHLPVKRHELVAKQYHLANIIDERIDRLPELIHRLRVELAVTVYTKVVPVIHKEYPTTWWDAFKERWFPKWALKRWPVQKTVVHIDVHEMYPTVPSIGPHQAVLTLYTAELPK